MSNTAIEQGAQPNPDDHPHDRNTGTTASSGHEQYSSPDDMPPDGMPDGSSRPSTGHIVAAVAVAALAMAVTAWAAMAVVGWLSPGDAVAHGDRSILNAEEVLVEAEGIMAEAVTLDGGVTADGAGCWYSYANAETNLPNQFLRCGPVLFKDSAADAPWMTVAVAFEPDADDDGATVAVLGTTNSRSSELGAEEVLRRPDGANAPTDIELEVPPPPAVADDHIAIVAMDDKVELEVPEDGRVHGPETQLEVLGVGTAEQIGSGPERLIAPDGHELMLIKFEAQGDGAVAEDGYYDEEGDYTVDGDSSSASANLVLSIDGVQRPVPGWGSEGPHRVAVVVPDDAEEVDLTLEESGVRSTFSLTALERTGGSPALYVSNPSVTVQRSYRSQTSYIDAYDEEETATVDGRLSSVELVLVDEAEGRAPEGSAFVFMTWSTFSSDLSRYGDRSESDLARSATVTVGDQVIPASIDQDGRMGFVVPEDTTQVALTYKPVRLYTSQRSFGPNRSGELVFPDALAFTVDFTTGAVS